MAIVMRTWKTRFASALLAVIGASQLHMGGRGLSAEQRVENALASGAHLCGTRDANGISHLKDEIFFLKIAGIKAGIKPHEHQHAVSTALRESERLVDRFIKDRCTVRLAKG